MTIFTGNSYFTSVTSSPINCVKPPSPTTATDCLPGKASWAAIAKGSPGCFRDRSFDPGGKLRELRPRAQRPLTNQNVAALANPKPKVLATRNTSRRLCNLSASFAMMHFLDANSRNGKSKGRVRGRYPVWVVSDYC